MATAPMSAEERYRWRLVASCVMVALVSVPLILRVIPPNGVYGFRTSLTRSNPEIWYPANAFMGWALVAAAAAAAALLVRLPCTARKPVLFAAWLLPILAAVAASFLYLRRLA